MRGHKAGVEAFRKIAKAASKYGVRYLTLYTFSTENWNRSKDEVDHLLSLIAWGIKGFVEEAKDANIKLNIFGDQAGLPKETRAIIARAVQTLEGNSGLVINLALNYGGRQEIINAINDLRITPATEDDLSKKLYTGQHGIPDPDLIIRTGGEMRLSNFLLWQAAYSELYFSDKMWPDFDEKDLESAIQEFTKRKRRFGK
jgi:undecaprenyl diphosphate synthase